MKKVKVLVKFKDKNTKKIKEVGEIQSYSDTRADELISLGKVELVETVKAKVDKTNAITDENKE